MKVEAPLAGYQPFVEYIPWNMYLVLCALICVWFSVKINTDTGSIIWSPYASEVILKDIGKINWYQTEIKWDWCI